MTDIEAGPEADLPRSRWRVTHFLIVLGFLAMAGFWIWAFSPFPTRGHPDTLDDKAFPEAAETRCAITMELIDDLPRDWDIDNPEQLAEQVAAGTDLLEPLVADLRTLARAVVNSIAREVREVHLVADLPSLIRIVDNTDEARKVRLWLDDWNIYLEPPNTCLLYTSPSPRD